jgi:beta-glucosidase
MTGHGQPEGGTNVGPASISERTLREVFFPPFAAAVHSSHALNVMASYNEIDGIPSHANYWLLHDILRGEMGFTGAVVSDYEGIEQLVTLHHVEPDFLHAAARAMHAGVDSDLPDGAAYAKLPEALSKGLVTQEQIDTAVRRMLREKFLSGLFENPYADAKAAQAITNNAEARTLAVQAARETTVLLKNDGALPLNTNIKTLAVVGPNAARVDLGGYSNVPNHTVSLLDGIRAKVGSRVKIVSAEGVRITDKGDWYSDDVVLADRDANLARIKQAVEVAKGADEIVLAIGSSSAVSREGWDKASHLGDRADIGLIAQQNELAQAMFALGKPVVVVLINGAPLSIPEVAAKANALLEAWYPGQEGGTALADILFGDANPGGKLPLTIARSIAQLPLYYNQKPTAHRGYLFDTTEPLFPFGFGLSYTTFDISAPHLAAKQVKAGDPVTVSVDVRNTGKVAGDEVVQLYLHDVVSSVTRPIKELKGFKRVTLAPGESKTVQFTLDREAFALWNQDMKRVVEPGAFEIMVGPNSVDLKTVTVDIT